MKKKLMMAVAAVAAYPPREASAEGGSMRGAFGAWADTETIGDYTWSYQIIDGNAEIYNEGDTAISPHPEGTITIPSTLNDRPLRCLNWRTPREAFAGLILRHMRDAA